MSSKVSKVSKVILNVSFEEKNLVKSLGAIWDPIAKYWFILSDQDQKIFKPWLCASIKKTLKNHKNLHIYEIGNLGLLRAITSCWSCKGYTTVYAIYAEAVQDKKGIFIFKNIIEVPEVLEDFLKARCTSFKLGRPNKDQERFFRNHCEHCKQGLSDEAFYKKKGVFNPKSESQAKIIQYIELPIFELSSITGEYIDYTDFSMFIDNVTKIDYVTDLL